MKASAEPDNITITYEEPGDFKMLGEISAAATINTNEDETQKLIINKLKRKAAKLGANAIIVDAVKKKGRFLMIPFIKSEKVSLSIAGRAILTNEKDSGF